MRYVLDCSVAIKWFVPESLSDLAERILARYEAGEVSFVAPDSIVAEFGHSLPKLVLGEVLTLDRSLLILRQFLDMRFDRFPAESLASEALPLAIAHMATFYDALYVALAVREECRVLTADERMVNAFASLDRTASLASFR